MAFLRWLGAFLMLALGLLGVSYMQNKFDEGDIKKALGAVQAKFPEAKDCRAEVMSRFQGRMRVQCKGQSWTVDVVRATIKGEESYGN